MKIVRLCTTINLVQLQLWAPGLATTLQYRSTGVPWARWNRIRVGH
jgi:hypothetical protein